MYWYQMNLINGPGTEKSYSNLWIIIISISLESKQMKLKYTIWLSTFWMAVLHRRLHVFISDIKELMKKKM